MVLEEVRAFGKLVDELKAAPTTFPHFVDFRNVVVTIHDSIKDTITQRLNLIASGGPTPLTSRRLRRLKELIQWLHTCLYNSYVAMRPIHRQMYYLTDHILQKSYGMRCNYIISVDNWTAVTSLEDILKSHRCDLSYPELWNHLTNTRLYFVRVVRKISMPERSLDWVIILHEIGHIIDMEKGIVEHEMPGLSVYEALAIVNAGGRGYGTELYETAKQKLHATEFAADLIVTESYGGIFGWRFLKEYGYWEEVLEETTTHPLPNARISIMIDELDSSLGLQSVSRLLQRQLEERGWNQDISALSAIASLQRIRESVRAQTITKFTQEEIKRELFAKLGYDPVHPPASIEDTLRFVQKGVLEGRPIIISPPLLYYVYMYGLWDDSIKAQRERTIQDMTRNLRISQDEFDDRIGELLSDCVRLFCVSQEW
ncbi:MAG: hypothetical protein ABSG74_01490 [Candidatus Bathyarchaeia archaeon]|jgi:hypothetical protein